MRGFTNNEANQYEESMEGLYKSSGVKLYDMEDEYMESGKNNHKTNTHLRCNKCLRQGEDELYPICDHIVKGECINFIGEEKIQGSIKQANEDKKMYYMPEAGYNGDDYNEDDMITRLMYKEIIALYEIMIRNSTVKCSKKDKLYPIRRICTILTVNLDSKKLYRIFDDQLENKIIKDFGAEIEGKIVFENIRNILDSYEFASFDYINKNKIIGRDFYSTLN